ncbi:hypothetical protein L484_022106 [Morus notabilis]|uniref:C2 domain-containing protein n=1 Tax=Morus notabilis TaxID=981085 RepID=W9QDR2_9ROSA|nr:uncharacterized protein LOC21404929 [Morus notabilis]EXB29435.1 hypothetical protein L484_022106 [Morus notabilis]
MTTTQHFSSLTCDMKIIEAKNIESKIKGNLFVRFYLPSSIRNNKTSIGVNTREISTKNDHVWNESFSLACCGIRDSIDTTNLSQESLVFELWFRNKVPVFGASKLLGRGEISLKDVLESPNMVFDKWVTLVSTRGHVVDGVKSPKLKVEMRTGILKDEVKRRPRTGKKWNECGCKDGHDHGCSYDDYDVFALAAALEAF